MKKNIIILSIVLITLTLMSFVIINKNDSRTSQLDISDFKNVVINPPAINKNEKRVFSDFIYDIGPRFSPIKKREIEKAISLDAFFSEVHLQKMATLQAVSIIFFIDDKQSDIRETGNNEALTVAQLKLLQAADYSTNFLIRVDYQEMNKETGELEDNYATPHLTIVPEKQAEYSQGKDALKYYLKENSKEARVNVDPEKLQAAKLFFTVTKEGTIENVKLDRSSNYPLVDKKMIELISKAPGTWQAAENYKGEKVDQELVVSFGLMGC